MAINPNIDEKKLLEELSQGSESAFTTAYNEYKNIVYTAALKITKSTIVSEETVQDIFMKIWVERENLSSISNFENYIYIIARNHLYNSLKNIAKKEKYIVEITHHDTGITDTDGVIKDEQYNTLLTEIIKMLPPQQQKVYKMARYEGLSHQKIGEHLGISTETVKKHMAQALKFIRLKISPYINMLLAVLLFAKL